MLAKPKNFKDIYLDHAATTKVADEVLAAMEPYFTENFGNPSSLYRAGRLAGGALNDSRRTIAEILRCLPENIIFTGSGTESDNLAIFGVALGHEKQGKHLISIPIEHHAVLNPLKELASRGWKVTQVKVSRKGLVNPDDVIRAITPETTLISVMYANNEIGAIEPIAEIGRALLKYRRDHKTIYPFFHTDACQAAGYLDLDVEKLHVDLLTINGSKIYGPKGIGALYLRRYIKLKPLLWGGEQERGLRAGTENVPGIVGLAKALELVQTNKETEATRIAKLSAYAWTKLQTEIPDVKLNGPELGAERLPNNLNLAFAGIENEALLLYLDEYGIMCSSGSACNAQALTTSHVLSEIGLSLAEARGSLRFTFGSDNTKQDVDYLAKYLPPLVEKLRQIGQLAR